MSDRCVIFIHGIWMPGVEMFLLEHRVAKNHGLPGTTFGYSSVQATLEENVEALARFIEEQGKAQVDLVGHSLGGVLALRTLLEHPDLPPGRVVCMGSPLAGSAAARAARATRWGSALIGRTLQPAVIDQPASQWARPVTAARYVGSIAGTQEVGVGRVLTNFDEPNDGTVAVSETRVPGMRDHICLHVTHSGMVFSHDVAEQVGAFLIDGRFEH